MIWFIITCVILGGMSIGVYLLVDSILRGDKRK